MLEQKLGINEHIHLGNIADRGARPVGTVQINVGCQERYIRFSTLQSRKVGQEKHRPVKAGSKKFKTHRNFTWLPFVDNAINYTPVNGKDVLSGPFSGCYMILYNVAGAARVGHVATPGAKAAWNNHVANQPGVNVLTGFQPHRVYYDALAFPVKRPEEGTARIFGLITNTGNCYALFCYEQTKRVQNGNIVQGLEGNIPIDERYHRVADIQLAPPLAVATLQNLP